MHCCSGCTLGSRGEDVMEAAGRLGLKVSAGASQAGNTLNWAKGSGWSLPGKRDCLGHCLGNTLLGNHAFDVLDGNEHPNRCYQEHRYVMGTHV
jgi:hypothetical protein